MTRVQCSQRECANWDNGTCVAEEVIVDTDGICLTQDDAEDQIIEMAAQARRESSVADVDDDDDDDSWDDDDWAQDDDEDVDDWADRRMGGR